MVAVIPRSKNDLARKKRTRFIVLKPKTEGSALSFDTGGNPIVLDTAKGYLKVGERWGSVKTMSGAEFETAQQLQFIHSHEIRLPSDSLTRNITPAYVLQMKETNALFQIISAEDDDFAKREVVCRCNTLSGDGV